MQIALNIPSVVPSASSRVDYYLYKIRRYLQVGSLLHLIAFVNYFIAQYFFNNTIDLLLNGFSWLLVLNIYLMLFFGSIPLFAELDAWSRWQNYKLFRDLLYQHGYKDRFAKSLIHSRCQREAAYIAALDVGLTDPVARYYYNKGYRSYHLIPDFVISSPGYLLTKNFWTTTFFAKRYKVKYFPE